MTAPFALRTDRLVLDLPTLDDVEVITQTCREPVFERFMVTPWPYEREHAVGFVEQYVPQGWADDTEYTWALRQAVGAPLLGVVGIRRLPGDRSTAELGYWMVAAHRGRGYMSEAVAAVLDRTEADARWSRVDIGWSAAVGNVASLGVARACGLEYTGERDARLQRPHGPNIEREWTARVPRPRTGPRPGWPTQSATQEAP